ncbi:305_t:CDS:2 [Acaulospora morrowiae]|uniref:305_t:CDS:1 n=1 Tax=Acaulospora morrowiae TaxID=94023 RepID=A0A9N8VCG6_9GLOM|nr:305_t:CDS:2 [Acaulospora morrowiae]
MSSENTVQEQIKYLKSLKAIRERAKKVYEKAEANALNHFKVDFSKLEVVVSKVIFLIKRDYKQISDIPPHGRWRHFEVGGKDRVQTLIEEWKIGCDTLEITRRLLDLFVVSVLLDAGAGNAWTYKEPETGNTYSRSEGLALASLYMFKSGAFSSSSSQPYQVDAHKLLNISVEDVRLAFQVDENNPLEGLEGRANLLSRLGHALESHPEFFKSNDNSPLRPGNLLDYLLLNSTINETDTTVKIDTLWTIVIYGFSEVWPPTRTSLNGVSLGDVWPCEVLRLPSSSPDSTDHLVAFHKLSQWLTYSLVEPMKRISGITFEGIEQMTGLPEYRNGGLFVDTGVLTLKEPDFERGISYYKQNKLSSTVQSDVEIVPMFEVNDPLIIEWRAVTVVLLDVVADKIRDALGLSKVQFSLAQMLEAGTWKACHDILAKQDAGREIAATLRPITRGPPIAVKSDGTVF